MTVIEDNNQRNLFHNICIVMIWNMTLYSSIIQYKYIQIPYGMLIIGGAILISFTLSYSGKLFSFRDVLTEENICILAFMTHTLLTVLMFSPDINGHVSQWITCMEYLFLQIVISSLIQNSGTNTFHTMLLVIGIILAIIFLRAPVDYIGIGRYSISKEVNPNGLGMGFAAAIWAILYRQQRSKLGLLFTCILAALFLYCILLTGSRKSFVAASMIIALWILFCFIPELKSKGFYLGVSIFIFAFFIVYILSQELLRIYEGSVIQTRMGNIAYEVSEGNRSIMYREGYELLKTNPLFGIGFQGFSFYFGNYSHATLIEIPVSGGIIGASFFFSAYYISLRKQIRILKKAKSNQEYSIEQRRITMILILSVVMLFYTTCIIHPYQFDSSILFGLIYGETAYLEKRVLTKPETVAFKKSRSKYIKYE